MTDATRMGGVLLQFCAKCPFDSERMFKVGENVDRAGVLTYITQRIANEDQTIT